MDAWPRPSQGEWATPGARLHFTTMFAESNDAFYSPLESGNTLFDAKGAEQVLRVTITPSPLADSQ